MRELFARFIPYFKDYIPHFIIAFIGMGLAAGGTAGSAYLVKPVLDEIFINKDENLLYLLPYAIFAMYLAKGVGRYLQAYYTSYIGQDIIRKLRDRMLFNILSLEISFFHEYRSGELISRLINDIERVRSVVSSLIPELIRESLTIVALMGVVIYQNPKLAFIAFIVLPLAIYPLSRLAKRMRKISKKSQEKASDITSILSEIFSNIEIIKANSTEKIESDRFKEDNLKFFNINMKAVKTNELVSPLMEILGSLAVVGVIIIGGEQVINEKMSVGSFFSFMTALFMLYTPIKRISGLYNKMQDAIIANERIFFLIDKQSSIIDVDKEINFEIETLSYNDVTLFYGENRALNNLSFEAKKGQTIALVGDSGGGKSSIINLLVRLYDPTTGSICFNKQNIQNFSLKSLKNSISIVTQRVYLFNDTIANNVAYGQEFCEQKVIQALKDSNSFEFVSSLPEGIYTKLSEYGANLSGGQRQRIAIARAFYKQPQIIIFDEATSALDNKSEAEITKVMKELSKDKITIIIAHRLTTVEHADNILLLKHGQILSQGDNNYLMQNCSEYQKLKGISNIS